jgi:CRP/FNR family transcriptional regulator, anaerobic regulatory protein
MQHDFQSTLQHFFGIPTASVGEISRFFEPISLKKGDFFQKTGRQADRLGFVEGGLVREFFVDEKGREVTKWIATPGYFVVDIASFLFQQPCRWHLQALTDCEILSISKSDYQHIGQYVARWPELEKMFIAKCFAILENRVVAHLSLSSEERYVQFFAQNAALFNQVPLQFLASMLGMTPETFSRIRRKHSRRSS